MGRRAEATYMHTHTLAHSHSLPTGPPGLPSGTPRQGNIDNQFQTVKTSPAYLWVTHCHQRWPVARPRSPKIHGGAKVKAGCVTVVSTFLPRVGLLTPCSAHPTPVALCLRPHPLIPAPALYLCPGFVVSPVAPQKQESSSSSFLLENKCTGLYFRAKLFIIHQIQPPPYFENMTADAQRGRWPFQRPVVS